MVKEALHLDKTPILHDIISFVWEEGTTFYKPLVGDFKTREAFLKKIQQPFPHVFVIGEAVSIHQGWTNGALESGEKILSHVDK